MLWDVVFTGVYMSIRTAKACLAHSRRMFTRVNNPCSVIASSVELLNGECREVHSNAIFRQDPDVGIVCSDAFACKLGICCFEHLIKEVHGSSAILNNAPPQLELAGDSRSHGEANRKIT